MAKTQLTLVLPGLAVILEQKINASIIPKYLAKIISKGQFRKDSIGLSRVLFNHFSTEPFTATDLPIVNLATGNSRTLRADPCYLHADRDRLLLFSDNIDLSKEESSALIAEIQPLFDDFGGVLSQSSNNEWLLDMQELPELNFSALPEVSGKGVDAYLPIGNDQQDWIRLWNEVQMKLYASDINQRRVEDNKLPINSVWFWGAGQFEAKTSPYLQVQGLSRLLALLADKTDTSLIKNSDFSVMSLTSGNHLWLADQLNIDNDWLQQIETFDTHVLKPLWQHCRSGKLTITVEVPDYGSYKLSALDCWKFW
mgnify:CR=1 FL=1